jgi:TRAP-type C4-dicarboxylate transport system permease small subunit
MAGESQSRKDSQPIPTWLVLIGGVPLLAAMGFEFLSVVARNTGMTFPAAIELVQASILFSSATAIVIATLSRAHAKVRLVLNRASGRWADVLATLNAAGGTVFFLALMTGSAWIAWDMWGEHEHSELLKLPYMPLRVFAATCMLITAVLYARRLLREVWTR